MRPRRRYLEAGGEGEELGEPEEVCL